MIANCSLPLSSDILVGPRPLGLTKLKRKAWRQGSHSCFGGAHSFGSFGSVYKKIYMIYEQYVYTRMMEINQLLQTVTYIQVKFTG